MLKGYLAALMTLTRLPVWRMITIDKRYFTDTLKYWPLVGYVTGFTTAGVLWGASLLMPSLTACILAILSRLLLTGAMHEDGLADFLDGFGGGRTREKILFIMKDSHIGCYGVIGLSCYFLLYASLLYSFDTAVLLPLIPMADVFSKLCASTAINSLPYVRKEEESKTRLIYRKSGLIERISILLLALIPFYFIQDKIFWLACLPAILCAGILRFYLKRKIGGYTGDCCGAMVLITEQVFYLGCLIIYCW